MIVKMDVRMVPQAFFIVIAPMAPCKKGDGGGYFLE